MKTSTPSVSRGVQGFAQAPATPIPSIKTQQANALKSTLQNNINAATAKAGKSSLGIGGIAPKYR